MKRAVLGIDAAWTAGAPSGVALVEESDTGWRTLALAPSYGAFIDLGKGIGVDWESRHHGSWPSIPEVLAAARALSSADIAVIALDMPLSTLPLRSRREADSAISRAFGGRGCSTHSPTPSRPGEVGTAIMGQLEAAGFPLATVTARKARASAIEVYPHPALLALLSRDYRVPYKVSRSRRYWPDASVRERIDGLLREFRTIRDALEKATGPLPFELPEAVAVTSLAHLKPFEDALDAAVCAWVGLCFLQGNAEPYGDATAAVWVPESAIPQRSDRVEADENE